MTDKIYLTNEGFLEIEEELNELKEVKRPEIIKALKDARSLGDLSENADYDAARNEQAQIESRILELEKILEKKDFSEKVKTFRRISTENYKLLTNSTYKDEYQKNMFRLIIEGLLNHPINSVGGYFLVHEEIGNYEELLQKQFSTTRHMIIRLNLNNMKSKIIKIGKEFIQFSCLAKKIFYNEIKHKK